MERYNRRRNGYEAQGSVEITRNGCQQRTHNFTMVGCEAAEDCAEAYRVTFRTEPCDGYYYELTGRVREVRENGCNTCERQTTYTRNGCDNCDQQANYTQNGCNTCDQQTTYTRNGCDNCDQQANYTQNGCNTCDQQTAYTRNGCDNCRRNKGTCSQCEENGGNETRIIDQAEDAANIWPECKEKKCGCNRTRQGSAFTYDSIRREQNNGSLWDNWIRRDNSTL